MPRADEFATIEEAIAELRAGRMIVLVDDENRENEGDLVLAAEKVTPEAVNFMLTHARGILCRAMSADICDRLHLEPQTSVNTTRMGTAFTVKFDARTGISTGTSVATAPGLSRSGCPWLTQAERMRRWVTRPTSRSCPSMTGRCLRRPAFMRCAAMSKESPTCSVSTTDVMS